MRLVEFRRSSEPDGVVFVNQAAVRMVQPNGEGTNIRFAHDHHVFVEERLSDVVRKLREVDR